MAQKVNEIEKEILAVYNSDHCRHTTFHTHITDIKIEGAEDFKKKINASLENYKNQRKFVHGEKLGQKPITLMDIATIGMKYQRKKGQLQDHVDDKIEYNAATISRTINGKKYRISFKNETHNSPTEVCPYDGAATALGGAVRDIMAARAFPYMGMRVTGCADPTNSETMPGKLPQKKITTEAAQGFADYGKGLGMPTGYLREIYHPDYVTKRLECGFVAGVVAAEHARIEEPVPGDVVVLIGGKTGRDGVGSAVASSQTQDEKSISTEGSQVPKGDPELERRIVELYRNPDFLKLVKKCNDFGAGGVSVAIGEIAESLDINLDLVPQREGANLLPVEIAISESQERMAVAIDPKDLDAVLNLCKKYNLEATKVADVTNTGFMRMFHKGEQVVNLCRKFINEDSDIRTQNILIKAPGQKPKTKTFNSFRELVLGTMTSLENCSQKGLNQIFGVKDEHAQGSVMLVPVPDNKSTVSITTFAYDPYIAKWSPYFGGIAARLDCLAKIIALGGHYKTTYLTDQEYYASPTTPEKFGHPFQALLGANEVSSFFGIAAIGGKDSMSGTYKDLDVPPTFISFAIDTADIKNTATQSFKKAGSQVGIIQATNDLAQTRENWDWFISERNKGNILTARAIGSGGIIAEICNAATKFGFKFNDNIDLSTLNEKSYGSILFEMKAPQKGVQILGETTKEKSIQFKNESISLAEIKKASEEQLATIFPSQD
jgi:phosphoribosylformylglycinamidine synthase